jgi:hypothetical protein
VETLKDKYFRPQGLVREIAGGQEGRQKSKWQAIVGADAGTVIAETRRGHKSKEK